MDSACVHIYVTSASQVYPYLYKESNKPEYLHK